MDKRSTEFYMWTHSVQIFTNFIWTPDLFVGVTIQDSNLVESTVKLNCPRCVSGPIFSNLSQTAKGRSMLCNRSTSLLSRLLPFIHHNDSVIRRGGAVGKTFTAKFLIEIRSPIRFTVARRFAEEHLLWFVATWLVTNEWRRGRFVVHFATTGRTRRVFHWRKWQIPNRLTGTFYAKRQLILAINHTVWIRMNFQYLDADKKREADPDLRKMLLESLAQLCATRVARDFLRSKGTYEILRELHKYECTADGDRACLLACENVVDILIRYTMLRLSQRTSLILVWFSGRRRKLVKIIWRTWTYQTTLLISLKKWTRIWLKNKFILGQK